MNIEGWAQTFNKKPDITVKKLAKDNNISLTTFYAHWQEKYPPKKYLTILRLMKALKLLAIDHLKIKDISWELKFCDHFYFCKWFKKYTGISPKQFQLRYGYYFRTAQYSKIKLKNFDIKLILWALKII
jgi:AraC-like DNA-binding protein